MYRNTHQNNWLSCFGGDSRNLDAAERNPRRITTYSSNCASAARVCLAEAARNSPSARDSEACVVRLFDEEGMTYEIRLLDSGFSLLAGMECKAPRGHGIGVDVTDSAASPTATSYAAT